MSLLTPLILGIETTNENSSIALQEGNHLLGQISLPNTFQSPLSGSLAHSILNLLECHNKKTCDITHITANRGPGSFTGIRLGLSFARAFSMGLRVPFYGVSSFQLLSFKSSFIKEKTLFLIDTKCRSFYSQVILQDGRVVFSGILENADLLAFIQAHSIESIVSSILFDAPEGVKIERRPLDASNLTEYVVTEYIIKKIPLHKGERDPFYMKDASISIKP